jgi:hypothetical protein
MQSAAQSLSQAAQALAKQLSNAPPPPRSQSGDFGAGENGTPDKNAFAAELKKYGAKTWGELPGELRTKLLQDMQVRYGDDYARIIQLYFEQIADKPKK